MLLFRSASFRFVSFRFVSFLNLLLLRFRQFTSLHFTSLHFTLGRRRRRFRVLPVAAGHTHIVFSSLPRYLDAFAFFLCLE